MKVILDYLREAEGSQIHYNNGEDDITAPYGIYRVAHPDAKIFKVIDGIARWAGILYDSSEWTTNVINRINGYIKNNVVMQAEVYEAVEEFYKDYLKGAHLDMFTDECKIAMMSMYTNSNKGAWKAVQGALITLVKNDKLQVKMEDLSTVDGYYGSKTAKALSKVDVDPLYFEALMLLGMLDYYVELWYKNPSKYGKYLRGWKERMVKLSNA